MEEQWAIGLGLGLPDILPISVRYQPVSYFAVQSYGVFALDFDVRVEYGRGVLASQGGLSIENPDLVVNFDGRYGPQYGIDLQFLPFSNAFYTSIGLGHRMLSLDGGLTSNVILTSSAGSISTNTVVVLNASAYVRQTTYRALLGWHWKVFEKRFFIDFSFGYSGPLASDSNTDVRANIVNPAATIDIPNTAIEAAERQFETDLKRQTKESVEPIESLGLPHLALSGGFHF